jgi:hypothetical protein
MDSAGNGCSVWLTVGSTDIWVHGFNDVEASDSEGRKVKAGADVPGMRCWGRRPRLDAQKIAR